MTHHDTRPVDLGRGRFLPSKALEKSRHHEKVTCSECGTFFYIKKGKERKKYKTCSPECSQARQNRTRKDESLKYRARKKFVGLYLDVKLYEKIKRVAEKQKIKVMQYIRDVLEREIK